MTFVQLVAKNRAKLVPASSSRLIWICLGLATLTWFVFGQTLKHEFINYDDPDYVYRNATVMSGLTIHGVVTVFTRTYSNNWHPITMLSHMLDCQLFGLNPHGHHITNVLFHTVAVVLLFLLLYLGTETVWLSAFVAAVFAIHPLHVESVAWVAERKDVLSAVFFMLTIITYFRYSAKPSAGRYAIVTFFFAVGLMCKPMLVTVPVVLLLLDYWPLRRFGEPTSDSSRTALWRLIVEKIPLFALSAISSIVTLFTQHEVMRSLEHLSLMWRLQNAIASCCIYIWQMVWPVNLAVIYPYTPSGAWPWWALLLGALSLLGITVGVIFVRRRCPYLITGWLWYLVMLLPVIGIVQVGMQAHADRYTYLPQIGLYVAVTWSAVELSSLRRASNYLLRIGAVVLLVALSWRTWDQTSYWRNTESLWRHTLAVTSNNDVAENNLANALLSQDRVDEAIVHYDNVVARSSGQYQTEVKEVFYNLANALLKKGRVDEAIANYRKSLQFTTVYTADVHNNLAQALLQKGLVDEAILHFRKVIELRSTGSKRDRAGANYNLGNGLLQKGQVDEAIASYQKAIELEPSFLDAYNNLGNAFLGKDLPDAAVSPLTKALELSAHLNKTDQAKAHYNLGNALLAKGHLDDAIEHYRVAIALWPSYSEPHNNLGNALLQKGLADEAIRHFKTVVDLRTNHGGAPLARARYNLANVLLDQGNVDDAIEHYRAAIALWPAYPEAHNNLGNALLRKGLTDESIQHFKTVVDLRANQGGPNLARAHYNLANVLLEQGNVDDAIHHYRQALELLPDYADAHINLGNALQKGAMDKDAIAQYEEALKIDPASTPALTQLAWVLATSSEKQLRSGGRAVEFAEKADRLSGGEDATVLRALAAAYAQNSEFAKATEAAQRALDLFTARADDASKKKLLREMTLYQSGSSYQQE